MEKRRLKKCFVSAPAEVNTSPIIEILKKRGISTNDFYSLGAGSPILSSVEDEIKACDFLLAVLSPQKCNPNVTFEIGLAKGAKKPILLIATDEGPVPYFLKNNAYFKWDFGSADVLSSVIDLFIQKQRIVTNQRIPHSKEAIIPSTKNITELINKLQQLEFNAPPPARGVEFNDLLEQMFRKLGIVVESAHGPDIGADMSIWIDSLESTLGNPLLIEWKIGKLSGEVLDRSERQLRDALIKSNLRSGILIYLDKDRRQFNQSEFRLPLVIRFEATSLLNLLCTESLESVLLKERNKIAHGGNI
jgi:nucleoside 2-deoxyribosyltransferase